MTAESNTDAGLVERLRKMVATPHVSFHYKDDVQTVEKAIASIASLSAEVERVRSDREYVIGWNDGFAHAEERALAAEARLASIEAAESSNLREAWSGFALIREAVETLGPVGAVQASENLAGPTFTDEAEAIVEGVRKMVPAGKPVEIRTSDNGSIDEVIAEQCTLHIEQMTADGWFIGIGASDGSYNQFWLGAKNRKSRVEVRHTETCLPGTLSARPQDGEGV